MKRNIDTVIYEDQDTFSASHVMGCRLFCVLIPAWRKDEYLASRLPSILADAAENVMFYDQTCGFSLKVRSTEDVAVGSLCSQVGLES